MRRTTWHVTAPESESVAPPRLGVPHRRRPDPGCPTSDKHRYASVVDRNEDSTHRVLNNDFPQQMPSESKLMHFPRKSASLLVEPSDASTRLQISSCETPSRSEAFIHCGASSTVVLCSLIILLGCQSDDTSRLTGAGAKTLAQLQAQPRITQYSKTGDRHPTHRRQVSRTMNGRG